MYLVDEKSLAILLIVFVYESYTLNTLAKDELKQQPARTTTMVRDNENETEAATDLRY